jgi:hypothetical protein
VANAFYYSSTAGTYVLTGDITTSSQIINLDNSVGLPGAVPFKVVIDPGQVSEEIVKCTAIAGNSLTVVRAWDGSTASSHSNGAVVRHMLTAGDLTLSRTHEAASSAVHGITGSVVGTTDSQALSNKNLSSGTNTFPSSLATDAELSAHTNATVAHGTVGNVVGTSDAQTLTNKNLSSSTNVFPSSLATDTEVAAASASASSALTAHANDTTTHGASGAVVGTTNTQTLTNKDLRSTSNKFPVALYDTGLDGSTQISMAGGWSLNTFNGVRRNGMAQVYLNVKRTGSTITPPGSMNLSNVRIGTINTAWTPLMPTPGSTVADGPLMTGYIWPDRTVSLSASSWQINTGDSITLGFTYALASY